jgi:hypothetical protein
MGRGIISVNLRNLVDVLMGLRGLTSRVRSGSSPHSAAQKWRVKILKLTLMVSLQLIASLVTSVTERTWVEQSVHSSENDVVARYR